MKLSVDAMQSAMGETKDKALRSVAFRLRNRATSQAWSSWVGMWRDASAARARFVGVFSRLRNREMTQGWLTWLGWWQACAAQRTHLRGTQPQRHLAGVASNLACGASVTTACGVRRPRTGAPFA